MALSTAIVVVPARDDGEPHLALLSRARLLIYPYVRRGSCAKRMESQGRCGCGCLWDNAIVGRDADGVLWRDRYGMLPAEHPVADPEDEPRLIADVSLRESRVVPSAVITPDGEIHHLGDTPELVSYHVADLALLEDLIMDHPDCYAVPFSCRF